MRTRRPSIEVPAALVRDIDLALAALDTARTDLERVRAGAAALPERRAAHARVSAAFEAADRLLRDAAGIARPGPYPAWRTWRHRLSRLDAAKQAHLFAQSDDVACLRPGSVRAVDTGMSGPSIGELQHGASRPPGTAPGYGLDLERALAAGAAPAELLEAPAEAREPAREPAWEPTLGRTPGGRLPVAA